MIAYLALGSNVGDRLANLRQAVDLLREAHGIAVVAVGSVYETEPVGVKEQPWFLNTAVRIRTDLSPAELLQTAKRVEATVGRTESYRWGPREIDVDILLYGDEQISQPDLVIPHPRIEERLFVLLPLRDLYPEWRNAAGTGIDALIEKLRGTDEIRPHPEVL